MAAHLRQRQVLVTLHRLSPLARAPTSMQLKNKHGRYVVVQPVGFNVG